MNNDYLDTTSYTNKDFRSIWPELLELVTDLTDKWDPNNSNEADPGVALLKLKAFVADKLNYNIDKNTLENFPSSVTLRGNAQKLYDSLGYELKWYKSAKTDIHFKFINPTADSEITEDTSVVTFNIPIFTLVCDPENTIIYTTLESAVLDSDDNTQTEIGIEAIEGPVEEFLINGSNKITINNLDADYRLYFTESMVASNGIFINNIGSDEFWESTFNLESTKAGRKVFKFGVLPTTNQCYIEFPLDAAELFEQGINVRYVISSGVKGNVKAKFLTNFAQEYSENGTDEYGNTYSLNKYIKVINLNGATSGEDPESLESAYKNYLRTVNTFSTLVTLEDYKNAIYNADVISNSIVTDRLNDFNSSYIVKNKSLVGSNDEIFLSENTFKMNAFNLCIYPLNKVLNVYDLDTYKNTFKTSSEAQRLARSAVEDLRSVQHDWINPFSEKLLAFLFKNMIGVSGQLITYQKVSTVEANQIIKKIKETLYKTYQSKNIDFGKDLDLDNIVKTIKSADSRVKDFLIDDPSYFTNVMYADNSESELIHTYLDPVTNLRLEDLLLEIIARNILAGSTPLFLFDKDTAYSYAMKPVGSYKLVDLKELTTGILNFNDILYNSSTETLKLAQNPNPNINDPITLSYKEISAITTLVDVPITASNQTITINNIAYNISVTKPIDSNYAKVDGLPESYSNIEWNAVPRYVPGDLVSDNSGDIWVNKSLAYGIIPSDGSSWKKVNYWNQASPYSEADVIIEATTLKLYKCKVNVSSNSGVLLTNATYWEDLGKTTADIVKVITNLPADSDDFCIRIGDVISEPAGYKLKTNETVFMYAPSYISKALVSTYLNVCIKDTTNTLSKIPADSLYELKPGLTLYISETVFEDAATKTTYTVQKYLPTSDAEIRLIENQGKAYRKYGPGTIIKPSFEMIKDEKGGISGSGDRLYNYVNLEASNTIDIMEANITRINKKSSDESDIATKQVYCAWITDDLDNYLFNATNINDAEDLADGYIEHILQLNELFMYTDATKSDLILLQSGTRVRIPYSTSSFNKDFWKMEKPSASQVNQQGLDALNDYWKEIPRSLMYFEVEELEIQTLGSGVTIYNKSPRNGEVISNIPTIIVDPQSLYWVYDNELYDLPDLNTSLNAGWKAFSRLGIFSSPETVCTLTEYLSICLFELEDEYNQQEDITTYSYQPRYVLGPGQSFTTNYVALLSGGIKQDIRVLKEDETLEPIVLSAFKYDPLIDDLNDQQLWDIYDNDKDILIKKSLNKDIYTNYVGGAGIIELTVSSDNVYQTKLKFSGEAFKSSTNDILLKTELSSLFKSSENSKKSGTIIPIIIEAPDTISYLFNLPTIDNQITSNVDLDPGLYHDHLMCLNYTDESDFSILFKNVGKNDIILITMYEPKHYLDYNEHLRETYSQVKYYVATDAENSTTANIGSDSYWKTCHDANGVLNIKEWDSTKTYSLYDVVIYKNKYYVLKEVYKKEDKIDNPIIDNKNWIRQEIQQAKIGEKYTQFNIVYYEEPSEIIFDKISDKVKELGSKVIQEGTTPALDLKASRFDYTYETAEEDQILDPLDPTSFYKENHVCNKFIISELNSIDIKLARLSKQ